ncbi:hypothetical protein Naga_100380g4 [Nannochloropsis gaditana]|uniref:Uncharacterized protein n=1 Tax=Nannochloropsis gaditana TaxID=72520 RepID=W7TIU9_9STRA|nr:hypothetical protein Naga_100380g4 [Nannochloropsis gaditana]
MIKPMDQNPRSKPERSLGTFSNANALHAERIAHEKCCRPPINHTLLASNRKEYSFSALEIGGSRTFKSTYSMLNASLLR